MEPSVSYSNDLHDALLRRNNTLFWKCWRSKFETSSRCTEVEQCIDPDVIAAKFASHFSNAYRANNADTAESLYKQYLAMPSGYCGFPVTDVHSVDTELVSSVIARLTRGKAADAVGLSAEHLIHSIHLSR